MLVLTAPDLGLFEALRRYCADRDEVELGRAAAAIGATPADTSRLLRHHLGWHLATTRQQHGETRRLYVPARRREIA